VLREGVGLRALRSRKGTGRPRTLTAKQEQHARQPVSSHSRIRLGHPSPRGLLLPAFRRYV